MNRNLLYNELIRRNNSLIKRIVRQYFPNQMDADDVFQEVTMHFLQKLEEISAEEIVKWESAAWLTTVCKNKCKDILKSAKNKSKYLSQSDPENLSNSSFVHVEDKNEETWKTSLREVLIQLKSDERKIILLRFIKGYTVKEVGDIMGLSNPSVYINRALQKLKKVVNSKVFFDHFDGWVLEDIDQYAEGE